MEEEFQSKQNLRRHLIFSYATPIIIGITVILLIIGGVSIVKFSGNDASFGVIEEEIDSEIPQESGKLIDSLIIDENDDVEIGDVI